MKQMRYMILAAVAVVAIYALFFDDKKSSGGRLPGSQTEVKVQDTVYGVVDSMGERGRENRGRPVLSTVLENLPEFPEWNLNIGLMIDSECTLGDLYEAYQWVQKYERGDSIDTARVMELEKKLEYLTKKY